MERDGDRLSGEKCSEQLPYYVNHKHKHKHTHVCPMNAQHNPVCHSNGIGLVSPALCVVTASPDTQRNEWFEQRAFWTDRTGCWAYVWSLEMNYWAHYSFISHFPFGPHCSQFMLPFGSFCVAFGKQINVLWLHFCSIKTDKNENLHPHLSKQLELSTCNLTSLLT